MKKTMIDIDDFDSNKILKFNLKNTKEKLIKKEPHFLMTSIIFAWFDLFIVNFFSIETIVFLISCNFLYGVGYFLVKLPFLKNEYMLHLKEKSMAEIEFLANKLETYGNIKKIPVLADYIYRLKNEKSKFIQMMNHKLNKTELYYFQSIEFIHTTYRERLHELENIMISHQTKVIDTSEFIRDVKEKENLLEYISEATKQLSHVSNVNIHSLERDASKFINDLKRISEGEFSK